MTWIPNSTLKRSAIEPETRKCAHCSGRTRGCKHCWNTGYQVGPARPDSAERKRRVLAWRFERSGLSQRQFCRQNKIGMGRLAKALKSTES